MLCIYVKQAQQERLSVSIHSLACKASRNGQPYDQRPGRNRQHGKDR